MIYMQQVRCIAVTTRLNMSMAKHNMTRIGVLFFLQQEKTLVEHAYFKHDDEIGILTLQRHSVGHA
jgi:hypothetical protein